MKPHSLSFQARKALQVHIGERAGTEIAELLQALVARIDELERSKVSVMQIVPEGKAKPGIGLRASRAA